MLFDHFVRFSVVFFIGCFYLVPSLCTLLCEFEIVHTSVRCVLELLLRLLFGGVRFAG